jgi:GNAT superfamily N-acetyltransferase
LIRIARVDDIAALIAIEIASGEPFRAVGMQAVADEPPLTADQYKDFVSEERSLVHVDANDEPVAYILLEPLDGRLFIEQVTTSPHYSGKRIGAGLIDFAAEYAPNFGVAGLSLTTFRDVPWNAPYYARLGFQVVADSRVTSGLIAKLGTESARGLAAWPRVAMQRG